MLLLLLPLVVPRGGTTSGSAMSGNATVLPAVLLLAVLWAAVLSTTVPPTVVLAVVLAAALPMAVLLATVSIAVGEEGIGGARKTQRARGDRNKFGAQIERWRTHGRKAKGWLLSLLFF